MTPPDFLPEIHCQPELAGLCCASSGLRAPVVRCWGSGPMRQARTNRVRAGRQQH